MNALQKEFVDIFLYDEDLAESISFKRVNQPARVIKAVVSRKTSMGSDPVSSSRSGTRPEFNIIIQISTDMEHGIAGKIYASDVFELADYNGEIKKYSAPTIISVDPGCMHLGLSA